MNVCELRPPVKRVGGKQALLPVFEEMGLYPEGWLDDPTRALIVPFMGGGSAMLRYSLDERPVYAQDADPELVSFFEVLEKEPERLIARLKDLQAEDSEAFYYEVGPGTGTQGRGSTGAP